MGDLTDDMVDGSSCSFCGIYFNGEHGFPVLCQSCWDDADGGERRGHARATRSEL